MPTTQQANFLFSGLVWIMSFGIHPVFSQSVELYTPYTKIAVPPGESIDYSIELINNSSTTKDVGISLRGLPDGWEYSMKSGGWTISQIAVLPGEKKSVSLKVDVPLKVEKGVFRFQVVATGYDQLPLTVTVSEKGTFKTEFTSQQPNMEGHADATFTFSTELKNQTAEPQLYALRANAPRGWKVTFKPNYKQATSVSIEANNTQSISIDIDPPSQIEAGTYKIPVRAANANTSAALDLEVVISGSYDMELTTPTGLLSTKITAGDEKRIELLVRNTGSSELTDVELSASAPANWDVIFDPKKVENIAPGGSARVYASLVADQKAIAGDYVANLTAKTPEVSSKAAFRISVKTPMLLAWIGVLVILGSVGGVFYLFRKYGRR